MVDITKSGESFIAEVDDVIILPVTGIGLIHQLHDGNEEEAMCGIAFHLEGEERAFVVPIPVDFFEELQIEIPDLIKNAKAGTSSKRTTQ